MLNALRNSAGSWIIKILFMILILSFGVWGVADYITRRPPEGPAITVGDITISTSVVYDEFNHDVAWLRSMLGQPTLTIEDAHRMGFMHRTIQRLVASATLDMAARAYGLVALDKLLVTTVSHQTEFLDKTGNFDPALFRRTVAVRGQSEEIYFRNLRQKLLRAQVSRPVMDSVTVPAILIDHLYRYYHEKRVVEMVSLPIAAMLAPLTPGPATLEAFYKAHALTFTAPEYRTLSAILLTASTVAPLVSVTDEAVREAYDDSLPALRVPETRMVEQVLSKSREQAEAVLMQVRKGRSLAQAAGDTMHYVTPLGRLSRAEMDQTDPTLAEAIFIAVPGTVVGPLQSALGWHLFQVTAITPEETPLFEMVRNQIREELIADKAGEIVYELSGMVEDSINRGASLEAAARHVGLAVSTFAPTDRSGVGMNRETVSALPPMREFLPTAFALASGMQSMVTESQHGFFVVRVDAIIPSRLKPMGEVRQELISQWEHSQRRDTAHSQAEAVAERLRSGIPLREAIRDSAGTAAVSRPLLRTDADDHLPPALIVRLFSLAVGETAVEETADTFIVSRLQAVLPPAADAAVRATLKQEVTNQYTEDILTQFTVALEQAFDVTINSRVLEPVRP